MGRSGRSDNRRQEWQKCLSPRTAGIAEVLSLTSRTFPSCFPYNSSNTEWHPMSNALQRSIVVAACSVVAACGGAPQVTVEFSGPAGSGEPNLFATADGRVLMSWFERVGDTSYALRVATRERGGWSPPRTVVEGRPFFVNWADFPSITELEDGSWVVHWLEKTAESPYAYHVKLVRSLDGGASWSDPVVPHGDRSPTEHGFVSMAPWSGGAALIWLDGRAMDGYDATTHEAPPGAMTVRATMLGADGIPLPDVLLDDRTCECCTTSMVKTSNGLLAAYRDRSTDEIRDVAVVRYVNGRWTVPMIVGDDRWHFPGCPVNGPQLDALGDSVVIAWFTSPNDSAKVRVAFSNDGGASFGQPMRVDDEGTPRGRVDVVWVSAEAALVSWLAVSGGVGQVRARMVHRDGPTGTSWVVALTEDGRAAGFPRMVRAGGEIVIAWTVPGERGGVRVAAMSLD